MDFMIGGELFFHLSRAHTFTEERTKFYAAELVLALEHLHSMGVIYRDMKPENIMLGGDGHIKITDFGLSKVDVKEGQKTNTFCGTPEYLAPEIYLNRGHNQTADWYSLGAIIYQMLSGKAPFYSRDKK
jgi:serine/threonine protein kinase